MADRKISDLTALTATASGDYVPIVDISEGAAASKNKRVTIQSLFQGIPVNVGIGTSAPGTALEVVNSTDNNHLTLYKTGVAGGAGPGIKFNNQNNTGGSAYIAGITAELTSGTPGSEAGALVLSTKETSDASPQKRVYISAGGNVGIGTTSPTTLLDVNADTVRVRTARTPASASATGATGEICWDASYIYVCTATNTWKRSALSTW